jgi:hypothetical protein
MRRLRVRNPQRGGGLDLVRGFSELGKGWIGIPSPVPTSWSRKSLKGRIILSPSAVGRRKRRR